ncbi:MAG: hypothetical protein RBT63_07075, partial [Bdellovibrionales bacterium]|nr:hypothetical protein [Bdellovibrionales bacterium]
MSSILIVTFSLIVALGGAWIYFKIKADGRPLKTPFAHAFTDNAHGENRKLLMVQVFTPAEAQALAQTAARD